MSASALRLEATERLTVAEERAAPSEDEQDARALERFLRTRRSRPYAALHARLLPTVHVAVARALSADPHRRGRHLVCDLCQEVFCHLLARDCRVLRSWEPTKGPLRPFVRTVAFHRARDVLRRPSLGDSTSSSVSPEAHHLPETDAQRRTEHRDLLAKLLEFLERSLPQGARRRVLEAMLAEERSADLVLRTGMSRDYVDKCTSDIRRRARAWRDEQLKDPRR